MLKENQKIMLKENRKKIKCKFNNCRLKSNKEYNCNYCRNEYCKLHKMPEIHECVNINQCISDAVNKNSDKLKKTKILKNKI